MVYLLAQKIGQEPTLAMTLVVVAVVAAVVLAEVAAMVEEDRLHTQVEMVLIEVLLLQGE